MHVVLKGELRREILLLVNPFTSTFQTYPPVINCNTINALTLRESLGKEEVKKEDCMPFIKILTIGNRMFT
mgnify:CR=1 FL=1